MFSHLVRVTTPYHSFKRKCTHLGKKKQILLTGIEFALARNTRIDREAKLISDYIELKDRQNTTLPVCLKLFASVVTWLDISPLPLLC